MDGIRILLGERSTNTFRYVIGPGSKGLGMKIKWRRRFILYVKSGVLRRVEVDENVALDWWRFVITSILGFAKPRLVEPCTSRLEQGHC
jgi:hypothetical protein